MGNINRNDMLELTRRMTSARSDKAYQDESEEVYQYLILVISPVDEEQVPHSPEVGFLYPAFTSRSTDINHVNFCSLDYEEARELMKFAIL